MPQASSAAAQLAITTALALWACGVAWHDISSRRIPNAALLLGIALGLVAAGLGHDALPARDAVDAALGALTGLLVCLPGYASRQLGAGDAKYAAVIGGLCGWHLALPLWLTTGMLLGLLALSALLWSRYSARAVTALPAGVALSGGLLGMLYRHLSGI